MYKNNLNVYPNLYQWGKKKLLRIPSLVWIMPEILIHITGNISPSQVEWGEPYMLYPHLESLTRNRQRWCTWM